MLCMGRMDFISKARVVGRGIRDGWRPPVCGNQTIIEIGAMDWLDKEVDKEVNKEMNKEVDKEMEKEMGNEDKEVDEKMNEWSDESLRVWESNPNY